MSLLLLFFFSRDGELVLMDAGSEYHGYASDITRTWPVSGKFSDAQRELYELVLRVHKNCLKVRHAYHKIMNMGRLFVHRTFYRGTQWEYLATGVGTPLLP